MTAGNPTTPIGADALPEGDYAIVEILGRRTMIGRVTEVERFGTKMLQVEPLFCDEMLGPVLINGTALYQFTPCTPAVAWARRPREAYQLPPSVAATVPPRALPSNAELPGILDGEGADQDDGDEGDGIPF